MFVAVWGYSRANPSLFSHCFHGVSAFLSRIIPCFSSQLSLWKGLESLSLEVSREGMEVTLSALRWGQGGDQAEYFPTSVILWCQFSIQEYFPLPSWSLSFSRGKLSHPGSVGTAWNSCLQLLWTIDLFNNLLKIKIHFPRFCSLDPLRLWNLDQHEILFVFLPWW